MTEKKWTKEIIKEKLETKPDWVRNAIVAIYKKQTMDEQTTKSTNHSNSIGYTGADALIMSSFAEQIIANKILSAKQLAIANKKIMKYAGQLAKIANGII